MYLEREREREREGERERERVCKKLLTIAVYCVGIIFCGAYMRLLLGVKFASEYSRYVSTKNDKFWDNMQGSFSFGFILQGQQFFFPSF